jgi:hypothetical protein
MTDSIVVPPPSETKGPVIKITINFKKQNYLFEFGSEETLGNFRKHISNATGITPELQKLMYKGLVKDDSKTLKELNIVDGSKLMLIGSTMQEVMETAQTIGSTTQSEKQVQQQNTTPLSEQLPHKKIIDKGVPEDAMPGIKGRNDPLPSTPLVGVLNNTGMKVRLTFKTFAQELWISSSSNTQKISFGSIRKVTSEPIKGKEEYHIMTLQLGQSENTKYMLYFVPAQYTKAIKDAIMSDFLGF